LLLIHHCLPESFQQGPNPKAGPLFWADLSYRDAMRQFERELLLARLERHGGSAKAAQQSLGLSKATFHRYLRELGVRRRIAEAETRETSQS